MSKCRLADWLTKAAGDEPIEVVVLGDVDYLMSNRDTDAPIGKLLTWEEALPYLQYKFYDGFGGAECHALYAWTATRIFLICEYDGSTRLKTIPRHPVACVPEYG